MDPFYLSIYFSVSYVFSTSAKTSALSIVVVTPDSGIVDAIFEASIILQVYS